MSLLKNHEDVLSGMHILSHSARREPLPDCNNPCLVTDAHAPEFDWSFTTKGDVSVPRS